MRTYELLFAKSRFFENYYVFARIRREGLRVFADKKGGVEAVRTRAESIYCAHYFYGRPLIKQF